MKLYHQNYNIIKLNLLLVYFLGLLSFQIDEDEESMKWIGKKSDWIKIKLKKDADG